MSMKKTKVLITALGTVCSATIVSELRKFSESFYIYGADINKPSSVVTSKDVDEFHTFPSAVDDPDYYLHYVLDFCKKNNIEYLYAIIDEEVLNLTSHRFLFENIGTKLCLTDSETVKICHFKNAFYKWLEKYFSQYLIKTYTSMDECIDISFPLFIKPIEGRASIGCRKITNVDELKTVNFEKFVVQEFVRGDVIVVDVIRSRAFNEIQVSQRQEVLRNGSGSGIAVKTVNYQELNDLAIEIATKLDLEGVISIELFKIEDGNFKIIEINPRLPAGTSYSCMAGCNTVVNMLKISQGSALIPCSNRIDCYFARRYETYEM